jgi:hypothetical protein
MRQILKTITKEEWWLVGLVIFVLAFINLGALAYGYYQSTPDLAYVGLFAQTPIDLSVYFSYIRQVKDGHILLFDYFTSENQTLGTFNVVWFLIGLIAWVFSLSPEVAFHLAKVIFLPVLMVGLYLFLSYIFNAKSKRTVSYLLMAFGSGLGYYFIPFFTYIASAFPAIDHNFYWPIDLYVTESNVFTSIWHSPHFILSWAGLIWFSLFCLLAFDRKSWRYSFWASFVGLLWMNFHPYYLPMVIIVPLIYLVYLFFQTKKINGRPVICLLIIYAGSFISAAYHLFLISQSAVIALRAEQNYTLSFYLLPIIVGLGLFLPLAGLGIYRLFQKKQWSDSKIYLLIWLSVQILIFLIPFKFMSRYLQGWQLPLAVFATEGLFFYSSYLKEKTRGLYLFLRSPAVLFLFFLFAFGLSNLFNIGRDLYYFSSRQPFFYRDVDTLAGFAWLDQAADKPKVVLACDYNALFIPAASGQKVYFAHSDETLDSDRKKVEVDWFFASNYGDGQKKDWLQKNKIDYLFYSGAEKAAGSFRPAEKKYLQIVYQNPNTAIYRVIKD